MDYKKIAVVLSISIIILFCTFCAVFCFFAYSTKENSSRYYKQGNDFFNKNDYQNAYYNFSKVSPFSDLFVNALFKQAKSAELLGDNKTALNKYKIINKMITDENVTPFVLWRIGNILFEDKNEKEAKKYFLKLETTYPKNQYGIASSYFLGLISKEKEGEYFSKYLKNSPDGKYSKKIIEILKKGKTPLTNKEKVYFSKALYLNKEYEKSIEVLKGVPINYCWTNFVLSLNKLNSKDNIIKIVNKGITLDSFEADSGDIKKALDIFVLHTEEQKPWDKIYKTSNNKQIKEYALYKSSLNKESSDYFARKLLLFKEFPESKYAPFGLFEIFQEALKTNNKDLALKYGKLYIGNYKDKKNTPCVLYFLGKIAKEKNDAIYKTYFLKLEAEYPESYYTYRLKNKEVSKKRAKKIKTSPQEIEFPKKRNKKTVKLFENFASFNDFSVLDDFRIEDSLIKSWVEYKKGNRAMSSVLARDYIQETEAPIARKESVWKLAYPIYYAEEINKNASNEGLNPYLMLALTKEESHFNPNIKSAVGATGLMQLMPQTAEMVSGAGAIGDLTDPDNNIKLGCKYFSFLTETFLQNEEYSVLSYNSGPNAVKKWINKEADFDLMVEKIPYKETKEYIKKVYGAYWNYILTYENIKP